MKVLNYNFCFQEEETNKRDDTFHKFKETHLKEFYEEKKKKQEGVLNNYKKIAKDWKVGSRCQVGKGDLKNRGTVKFIGETKLKDEIQGGLWIGIEYDEPYGQHNGTVNKKSYFKCKDKYGTMVRPDIVEVGDFPPVDELDELESDDDDMEL